MRSDEETVYVIRDRDGADGWVSPAPAADVIAEAVAEATRLEPADIDDLDAYVDAELLRAVIAGEADEQIAFTVEGHSVTVTADGAVDIDA